MRWVLLSIICLTLESLSFGQTRGTVQYKTNDFSISPTNLLASNILAGANITVTPDAVGRLTLAAAGGAGEVNVNGEVSVTNAFRVGLVYDKVGVTNRLRSIQPRYGLVVTNEGTNVSFAIDPLIVGAALKTQRNSVTVTNITVVLNFIEGTNVTINATNVGSGQVDLQVSSTTFATATDILNATNTAQVTNWINFRQLASANLTNWSGVATNIYTTTNDAWLLRFSSNGVAVAPGNGLESVVTNGSGIQTVYTVALTNAGLTNYSLFSTSYWVPQPGGTFLTNWANAISNYVTSATNSTSVTNWINSRQPADAKLTNYLGTGALTNTVNAGVSNLYATNISVRAGVSTSNAFVGGTLYVVNTAYTNLNALSTLSNLANLSVPAHTITNNGDSLWATWGGIFPVATANTNQFQIVFGATTILDTGLQISSNCSFRASCQIYRTATSAQHAEGHFEWGPGGGVPWAYTNSNLEMAVDTGAAQTLALKGAARRVGAHTNNSFMIEYKPAPRL